MKIGILTVPFNNNYGGVLQAYALKCIITQLGHDVVFINRRRDPNTSFKYRIYKTLVKLGVIEDYLKIQTQKISVHFERFIEEYLFPLTEPYYSTNDIKKCLNLNIDCFIVGSDQVWRYKYAEKSLQNYFFDFLNGSNLPRFSYAASFGIDELDYPINVINKIRNSLRQFSAISVREKSGVSLLENIGINTDDIKVVLDPTLLLTSKHYSSLINQTDDNIKNILFTYVLDEKLVNSGALADYVKENKLGIVDIKAQVGKISQQTVLEPVEKWLASIKNAKYVITDSFHGTVFSIIFNKPFLVLANPMRGTTRLTGMLSSFGLENRIVYKLEDAESIKEMFDKAINWNEVNKIIEKQRQESLTFIKQNLKI